MAKYQLKVTKTKMYRLIQDYRTDFPKMSKCDFTHYGSVYWMEYFSPVDCCFIRFTLMICLGSPCIRIVRNEAFGPEEQLYSDTVSLESLRRYGMLQEVA